MKTLSLFSVGLFALTAGVVSAAPKIEFNRDIRPILSDNCFKCHGPDSATRKGDLRLDRREDAPRAGAIVAGNPDKSKVVQRILSTDPTEMMPPPKSLKTLKPEQKELLRRWIAEGAEYQAHWSFIPPAKDVPVPVVEDPSSWSRNPLDRFVLSRLRELKVQPAEEAIRERWLRRVTFDLTGLPPTLSEIDAFLADTSADARERIVDRLLQSPSFGERFAVDWLDAARYADTFGYQADRDTHLWPWRDWVVRAFNANLPYSDFILWQTAGDLLEKPSRDQYLATAFNRLHRQTNEGGSIEEEFRLEYVSDRVHTNATAFLGLTLECARCHEHKYDPISQKDYYQLSAFFNSIDEHGLYSHFTETAPTPTLLLYEGEQEAKHKDLLDCIRTKERELTRVRDEARKRFLDRGKQNAPPTTAPKPAASFTFDDAKPGGGNRSVEGRVGKALQFGGDDAFVCKGAGAFGRTSAFTFSLWVKPGELKPRSVVFHRSRAAEDSAFRGYSLILDEGRPIFSLIHFWPGNAVQVQTKNKIPAGEWTHLAVSYDGSSKAEGVTIFINGTSVDMEVVRNRLTRDIVHRREWGDYDAGSVELALGARFRDVGFKGGAVDEFLVFDQQLTPLEVARVGGFKVEATEEAVFQEYLLRHDEPYQTASKSLQELRVQENDLVSAIRQIMVMREMPNRRPTHVLKRGVYTARGEAVEPDTPSGVFPFPSEYPRNRLGFAYWLIDERNPLTARVTVNRFWMAFFGRGLVPTPEDFGGQGQQPSHPELLDWLARYFIDSGWDIKALCRTIALSATYGQSSIPRDPKWYAEDPENRWLGRGPKHRLPAEQIRDNALAASGLLVRKMGGPAVMPYQPTGLWEESGTGKSYAQSKGEGLYRRSLYTFWRRTSPPPSMTTFDAVSREVCVARRERTATPLQALVLLNDPQYIEAARVLAEKLIHQYGEKRDESIHTAFRTLTGRVPSEREMKVLIALYTEQSAHFQADPAQAKSFLSVGDSPRDAKLNEKQHAALTVVIKVLLNFDECTTIR